MLRAIDIVCTLQCPSCRNQLSTMDGSDWSLNIHNVVRLKCSCGRSIQGELLLKVRSDNQEGGI